MDDLQVINILRVNEKTDTLQFIEPGVPWKRNKFGLGERPAFSNFIYNHIWL